MSLPAEPQSWTRDGFLISTDKTLLSVPAIGSVFGQEFMYWTNAVPDEILQQIIQNSFCFGVYTTGQTNDLSTEHAESTPTTDDTAASSKGLTQIGFARLVTDSITFAYLTDLYVLPGHQGLGLGGWLIDCVGDLLSPLPYLRWFMLRTSVEKSKEAYEKRLGMGILATPDVSQGAIMMGKKGKGNQV